MVHLRIIRLQKDSTSPFGNCIDVTDEGFGMIRNPQDRARWHQLLELYEGSVRAQCLHEGSFRDDHVCQRSCNRRQIWKNLL